MNEQKSCADCAFCVYYHAIPVRCEHPELAIPPTPKPAAIYGRSGGMDYHPVWLDDARKPGAKCGPDAELWQKRHFLQGYKTLQKIWFKLVGESL